MKTIAECEKFLGPLILQQHLGTYLTMTIGALVCIFVFRLWYKTNKFQPSSIVTLLLGVCLVLIANTGLLPVFAGSLDKPAVEFKEIKTAIEFACLQLIEKGTGEGEPDQADAKVVPVPASVPAAAQELNYLKDKGFVWLFYSNSRGQDAIIIGKKLDSIGISYQSSVDEFQLVKNKKPHGASRIVFSSPDFKEAAIALGKLVGENTGTPIVVEGPYGSISKKPIQVQLY